MTPSASRALRFRRSRLAAVPVGVLALLLTGCGPASQAASGSGATSPGAPSSVAPVTPMTPSPTLPPTPPRTTAAPTPSASASATPIRPQPTSADAVVTAVPLSEWQRIVAVGAWHSGCPVTRTDLRRVEVNFHGFDGAVHRGVLVVNADVATSVAAIFTELFDRRFPIHRMEPIEVYGGDDNASMAADNTSAYNCRRAAQANAPATASPHANGRAIDVNPYENPWIDSRCQCFQPDSRYGTTRTGAGVITKGGVAWTAFTREGWIWQDNATIDYQHFDTGYPSRPLS